MAIAYKTLRIDITTEQSFVYLKARQYDEQSRTYKLIITSRNIPIPVKGTELVTVLMARADKTYIDTVCEWKNGELFFTLTEGMLAVSGEALLEFVIYDTEELSVIGTTHIHLDIQPSLLPYERIVKSDEFNVLNNLILQANAKFTDTTYEPAGINLGLVKSGGDVTISDGTITVNDSSHNHVISNIDGLKDVLDEHAENADIHFTDEERNKLNNIEVGANKYIHPISGIKSGTYKSVTVDENGHVINGTNPTTLAGYGITDAEIKGSASSAVSTHNTSTSAHNDIRDLINGLTTRLNTLADSDDKTLDQMSEIVAYIKTNKELIDSITTSKINVSDIVNNLTTNISNKPLSAAQGVTIKSLIDNLQTELDKRATSSDLASHVADSVGHITSTERTNWNDANSKKHEHSNKSILDATTASYTTALNTKLSGIATGAEVNQNAFSNVKVASTTIAADSKTDTLTLVSGDNITITPDSTNDKITIAATDTVYTHPSTHSASMITGLATVATSGKYSDLSGVPEIPTKTSQLTNDSGFKTTDNNTTYSLSKSGNKIVLTGSDGSETSVTDSDTNTTYSAAGSSLGTVKSGGDVTISSGIITVKDDSHNHVIGNVDGLQDILDAKVPATRTVNGKALSANITLSASDVGADASGSASSALESAKEYVDNRFDSIVGEGASTTLDTIGEISKAIEDHQDVTDALNSAIGNKVDKVDGKHLSTNDYTTAEKTKLSGIASGAEVNQNAFGKVAVGSTTISADAKVDTLTLVAGNNVTITPDTTNDKITIASTDTTYYDATATVSGLMSAADKSKLDGITSSADSVSFTQSLTSGTQVGTITINGTATKLYAPKNTDTNVKQTVTTSNASYPLLLAPSGQTATSTTSSYFDSGVTLNPGTNTISANISGNADTATLANKLGSSTIGGDIKPIYLNSGVATACAGTVGGTTTPIYMNAGTITACSYTLEKSVPSDAKFTDTTYSEMLAATSSTAGNAGLVPAPAAGKQSAFLRGDGVWATPANTKNTTGSTNSSDKLFLIGAKTQASAPQTYSHDTTYIGEDGCLYSNNTKVSVEGHEHTCECLRPYRIDFTPNSTDNNGGYIDFNYNNSSDDYTSRIIEDGNGHLSIYAPSGITVTHSIYTYGSVNGYMLNNACEKDVDATVTEGSTQLITSGGVYTALQNNNVLSAQHGNEINFKGLTNQSILFFNYRNGDNGASTGNSTPITSYMFGDKNGADGNYIRLNLNEGIGERTIFHSGNMNGVAIAETAPATTFLWIDTINKKVKFYKDGAWEAIS